MPSETGNTKEELMSAAQKRIDENLSIHNNNTRQRKDWFDINLPAIEKF